MEIDNGHQAKQEPSKLHPAGLRHPPTGPRSELKRPRRTPSYQDTQEAARNASFQNGKRVRPNRPHDILQSSSAHYTEEPTEVLISPTSPIEESEDSEVESEKVNPSKLIADELESWLEQVMLTYPSAKIMFGEKNGKLVVTCAHCVELCIEIDFNKPDFTNVDLHLNTPLHQQNLSRNFAECLQIEDVPEQSSAIQYLTGDERSVRSEGAQHAFIKLTSRFEETNGRIDEIAKKLANLLLKKAGDDETLTQMEAAIRALQNKKGDKISQSSTLQVLQNDVMRARTEINALAVKEDKTRGCLKTIQEDVAKSQKSVKTLLSNGERMTACLKTISERVTEDGNRAYEANATHVQAAEKNAEEIQANTENITKALDSNREEMKIRLDTLSEQVVQNSRANETHIHAAKRMVKDNQTTSEVLMKALNTNATEMTIRLDALSKQAVEDKQSASCLKDLQIQTTSQIVEFVEDFHTKSEALKEENLSCRQEISGVQERLTCWSNDCAQKLELHHQQCLDEQKIAGDERKGISQRTKDLEGQQKIKEDNDTKLRRDVADFQKKIEADSELSADQNTKRFKEIETKIISDCDLTLNRFNAAVTTYIASRFIEIESKIVDKEHIDLVVNQQFSLLDKKLNQTADTLLNIQTTIDAQHLERLNQVKLELAASQNQVIRAQDELRHGQEAIRVKREDEHNMLRLEHEALFKNHLSTKIFLNGQITELVERIDRREEYMEEQRIRHENQMKYSRQANDEHVAGLLATMSMAEKKGQQEIKKKLDVLMQRIDTLENARPDPTHWSTPTLTSSPKPWSKSTPTPTIDLESSIVVQEFPYPDASIHEEFDTIW